MKKPYLFFITIACKTIKDEIKISMKYDLEKIQTTTKNNIITIIKDLLSINNNDYKFFIKEINLNDKFNKEDLKEYLRHFVYYDEKISNWIISHKNEPDYNILNCINEDINIKMMLIGSSFKNIMSNQVNRESLLTLFEKYFHIKPSDISLYTVIDNNGNIDIDSLYDILPSDKSKKYAILLQDEIKLSMIKSFTKLCYNKPNIEIFVSSNSDIYKVTIETTEIVFKRVVLR